MTPISSPHNRQLKELRRLQRRRERDRSGTFAVEGEDLIDAARAAQRPVLHGYRLAGSGLGEESFLDVEAEALAAVSALGSGTRVIGVYEQRWGTPSGPLCVYLHGIRDPGNVGTILRSAHAFGASSVVLGPGCADPHGPRAVRGSMGAIFSVTLAHTDKAPGTLPGETIALVAHHGEPLQGPATTPVTLLVGAEREGLPDKLVDGCDRTARIPIAGESLNAAMAATVALYEMTRDRVPAP